MRPTTDPGGLVENHQSAIINRPYFAVIFFSLQCMIFII